MGQFGNEMGEESSLKAAEKLKFVGGRLICRAFVVECREEGLKFMEMGCVCWRDKDWYCVVYVLTVSVPWCSVEGKKKCRNGWRDSDQAETLIGPANRQYLTLSPVGCSVGQQYDSYVIRTIHTTSNEGNGAV
jgi:hypothetical protein